MDPICSFRRVLGGVAICRVVTQRIFKESLEQTYPWKPKKLGISPANDSAGVANDCLLLQEQKKCTAACVGEPYFATNNMAGKWVAFGEGVFCNVPRAKPTFCMPISTSEKVNSLHLFLVTHGKILKILDCLMRFRKVIG